MKLINKLYITTKLLSNDKPILENSETDSYETLIFLENNLYRNGEGGLRTRGLFKKSYPDKPLISIVTVVFNGEKYLEQTILSVLNQTYDNVEYIIIDGGSTDDTLEIIKKYEDSIDYWVSEKDKGIYGAMNKGITLCQGDLVGLINADDYYEIDAVESVLETYSLNSYNKDAVYHGSIRYIIDEKKGIVELRRANENISKIVRGMVVNHPATFLPINIYKKHGFFSIENRVVSDWDLMLRLYNAKIKFVPIEDVLANFRKGGISCLFTFSRLIEEIKIRKTHSLKSLSVRELLIYIIGIVLGEKFLTYIVLIKNYIFDIKTLSVLNDINLTLNKGDKIAFVGESGAGKSTLADIIIGLYRPNSGCIKIDGVLLNDDNLQNWRSQIGYVPQQVYLFDGTVADNICFGRQRDDKILEDVLKQANIYYFLQTKEGLETLVGEGGIQLSGGQKQRIAIARALYGNPEILVLDEATSALDNDTEEKIMKEIYHISKDKTLIVIAHRLTTIKGCDKVFEIKNKLINV